MIRYTVQVRVALLMIIRLISTNAGYYNLDDFMFIGYVDTLLVVEPMISPRQTILPPEEKHLYREPEDLIAIPTGNGSKRVSRNASSKMLSNRYVQMRGAVEIHKLND